MTNIIEIVLFAFSIYLLVTASIFDIKTHRIPNWVTMPMMLMGLILTICIDPKHALIEFAAIVMLFLFSFTRLMGAGDIKLIMAMTALCGVPVMLFTVLSGTIIMLLWWIVKAPHIAIREIRYQITAFINHMPMQNAVQKKTKVPFAPFLAVGYVLVCIGRTVIC